MQVWELDFQWLRVRHAIKNKFGRTELPDLKSVLFLIGIQEVGNWDGRPTKEQKQDYMHVATCELLSQDGYYEFVGLDDEGWPHYQRLQILNFDSVEAQENHLKACVINYFKDKFLNNEEE